MNSTTLVGREAEIGIFDRILRGRSHNENQILLVVGPPGRGKSLLMSQYLRVARQHNALCAPVDLNQVGTDVLDILTTLYEWWCDRCAFPRFQEQRTALNPWGSQVIVQKVVQFWGQLKVTMGGIDEGILRDRYRLLTEALMDDLTECLGNDHQAVLLIDAYDGGLVTDALRQWLGSVVLPYVYRTPNLIAVVAGQEAPSLC